MITHKSDVLKLKEMGCNSSLFFYRSLMVLDCLCRFYSCHVNHSDHCYR
nr:MAG TPA: hypothetical protein [Caudoviricetes sp.]